MIYPSLRKLVNDPPPLTVCHTYRATHSPDPLYRRATHPTTPLPPPVKKCDTCHRVQIPLALAENNQYVPMPLSNNGELIENTYTPAIMKQGKQSIPASPKNLDAPGTMNVPPTELHLTKLIATQQRLRNKGKTANRFAPLTPEEDEMDFESEPPTAPPSTQPASSDSFRGSSPTPSRPTDRQFPLPRRTAPCPPNPAGT